MKIKTVLSSSLVKVLKELNLDDKVAVASLEHPSDVRFGDLSSNIAMTLFSKLHKNDSFSYQSPRELATKIVELLLIDKELMGKYLAKVEVAGAGFINFTLSSSFLVAKMGLIIKTRGMAIEENLKDEKIMVEFTDPNPFKELHIGHLYSNTVGEAIAKLLESQGAKVKRACYQGDVGMHVAKSIWGMQQLLSSNWQEELMKLEAQEITQRVAFLGRAYALGATRYQDDKEAKERIKQLNALVFVVAQERLVKETGFQAVVKYRDLVDKELLNSSTTEQVSQLYNHGRSWSLEYFNSMYQRIGMKFDEFFFESEVGERGYTVVKEFLAKGVFVKSKGAVIFAGSQYGLHDRVFINSLGLPTYEAKELGLAPEKYQRYQYDRSLVITGNEINEYFKVLLTAMKFTNPKLQQKTVHLSHGMVRLPSGKMSSRTGVVVTAKWLMDEAQQQISSYMHENNKYHLTEKELVETADKVGLGAIKYAFLKQSIGKDIIFSFKESLSFSGNSGPYLQYSLVRCNSIIKKAKKSVSSELLSGKKIVNTEDLEKAIAKYFDILLNNVAQFEKNINNDEKNILRNLYKYSDILKTASQNYAPQILASYLYDLAQNLNSFYGNHQVVGSSNFIFRLLLVLATAKVLKHGLSILDIQVVDKM